MVKVQNRLVPPQWAWRTMKLQLASFGHNENEGWAVKFINKKTRFIGTEITKKTSENCSDKSADKVSSRWLWSQDIKYKKPLCRDP